MGRGSTEKSQRKSDITLCGMKCKASICLRVESENEDQDSVVFGDYEAMTHEQQLLLLRDHPDRERQRYSKVPGTVSIVEDQFLEEICNDVGFEPDKPADLLSRNGRKKLVNQISHEILTNSESPADDTCRSLADGQRASAARLSVYGSRNSKGSSTYNRNEDSVRSSVVTYMSQRIEGNMTKSQVSLQQQKVEESPVGYHYNYRGPSEKGDEVGCLPIFFGCCNTRTGAASMLEEGYTDDHNDACSEGKLSKSSSKHRQGRFSEHSIPLGDPDSSIVQSDALQNS